MRKVHRLMSQRPRWFGWIRSHLLNIGGTVVVLAGVLTLAAPAQTGASVRGQLQQASEAASSAQKCTPTPGSGPGVTSSQIDIGLLIFLAGAGGSLNSAIGLPTIAQQQTMSQAVADSINASGGIACRKVVLKDFQANAIDPASLQQTCQQVASSGVFAVIDPGAYNLFPTLAECYPQHHIPYFTDVEQTQADLKKFAPYLFAGTSLETTYRDTVLALKAKGYFNASHGFKKLGLLVSNCTPALVSDYTNLLKKAGVSSSNLVTFNVGCPTGGSSSASTLQQAVLQFKQAGVNDVSEVQEFTDYVAFTKIAEQQGFNPTYLLPDEEVIADGISGPQKPDYTNMANAILVSTYSDGDQGPPIQPPSAGTTKCSKIMAASGQPSVYKYVGAGGLFCDALWELQTAAEHTPKVEAKDLAAGLRAAGTVNYSFPEGPNNFKATSVPVGGEYWRMLKFNESCDCFQAISGFKPSL